MTEKGRVAMAGDVRLCIACAEEIKAEARLCKHCKTAQDDPRWSQQSQTKRDDTLVLNPDEQRVPQGSMTPEEWDARGAVEVKKGSEEHENAGSAFDPTVQPKPDDLVPADCIWAVFPWPGPLRSGLIPGRWSSPNPAKFFDELGDVRGWTYAEFERCAGAPFNSSRRPDGGKTVIWSHGSLFGAWSAAFYFDKYGICYGIGSETQI